MPSKENAPELLLERLKKLDSWLESKAKERLFDKPLQYDFRHEISALENGIKTNRDEARKLRIGIIGQVKAGKSSFLNTIIFDGEQLLPKAATPMTAALTKLSYSEVPKAVVHYYSQAEWSSLEEANHEFEARLEEAYEKYKQEQVQEPDEKSKRNLFSKISSSNTNRKKLSKEEYEKKIFRKAQSEYLQAGRELVGMVTDPGILSKIDTEEKLAETSTGGLMETLKKYVGAGGEYTPIVSYVDLMLPEEQLRNVTIIDTPGLNDPIRSREQKTREFLEGCDVAFLLSPCSQFMDETTIELMARRMPDAGIQNIVVVGSKLDSGVCNDKGRNMSFQEALGSAVNIYRNAFNENIKHAEERAGNNRGVIATFRKNKVAEQPIFFSAMCYQIDKILKSGKEPDPKTEEGNSYRNLCSFAGFQAEFLSDMSGVQEIKDSMQKVLDLKEELISGKNADFYDLARKNALASLNQIQNDAIQRKKDLKESPEDSPNKLKERYKSIEEILESSRIKIRAIFETAGYEAEKNAVSILNNCNVEMENHDAFKVDKHIQEDTHVEHHWFRADTVYTTTETTYIAETNPIITNIRGYINRCKILIDDGFSSLFNKEALRNKLENIIMNAYKQNDYKYDKDDILMPLNAIFEKISIPKISINSHEAIDTLNSYYPEGRAVNDEISKLAKLQSELLENVACEVGKQIRTTVETIQDTMREQAEKFVNDVKKKLGAKQEDLLELLKEKETNLQKFDDFIRQFEEEMRLVQEM